MPIARVTFETVDLLERAVTTDFGLVFNGKETFVERERPKKVVRCYNCMLYGHIKKIVSQSQGVKGVVVLTQSKTVQKK